MEGKHDGCRETGVNEGTARMRFRKKPSSYCNSPKRCKPQSEGVSHGVGAVCCRNGTASTLISEI